MAAVNLLISVDRPWPNFIVVIGPFFVSCLRMQAYIGHKPWFRELLLCLRLGRCVWYYSNDPRLSIVPEGASCTVRRLFAPKRGD